MTILAHIVFSLMGGWLSRMCGGAPPKLPWGLDQWFYAMPYMLIGLPALGAIAAAMELNSRTRKYAYAILPVTYFSAVTGKRTGHGGGLDMGNSDKEPGDGRDPEKLEYLILWLHDKMPRYWYDALLMAITGVAVTIPAGIVVSFLNPGMGVFLALSGLSKAPAYMIGWTVYPIGFGRGIPHLNEATAVGEFLTGFFGYAALGIVAAQVAL